MARTRLRAGASVLIALTIGGPVAAMARPRTAAAPVIETRRVVAEPVLPTPAPSFEPAATLAAAATPVAATPGRPDPASAAIAAVRRAGGVPLAGGRVCKTSLVVSYDDPGAGWTEGVFVPPLGPSADGNKANGVVACPGSHHAFVGFQAAYTKGRWVVRVTPDPKSLGGDDHAANIADKRPAPPPAAPGAPLTGALDGPDIEGYAGYEGQSTCDPSPKPGTLALRNLLLSHYPGTGSSGISRACDVGGRSEHKEGRAFDWSANVGNAKQRAAVEDFIGKLLATDSYGHAHAMARRMGVMYVIWNRQIWSAYRGGGGWQPYTGASPHTDHVHISLSWAGARAETSFWSGTVVLGLFDPAVVDKRDDSAPRRSARPSPTPSNASPKPARTPKPIPTPRPVIDATPKPSLSPRPSRSPSPDGRRWRERPTPSPVVSPSSSPSVMPSPSSPDVTPAPSEPATSPLPAGDGADDA